MLYNKKPGAYRLTQTTTGPAEVIQVIVPSGVMPGSQFSISHKGRSVRVRCPTSSRPGKTLQVTLPPEPVTQETFLVSAKLTSVTGSAGGGAVAMNEEASKNNYGTVPHQKAFLVTIPPKVHPGMQFTIDVQGQHYIVTCPQNAGPNKKVKIVPPASSSNSAGPARKDSEDYDEDDLASTSNAPVPKTQVFEVRVPKGVGPLQPFALMADGRRVLVTCPPNVKVGETIRFRLPVQQMVSDIRLSYDSKASGWVRTIRVQDLKFQWVRINKDEGGEGSNNGSMLDVHGMNNFDFSKAAYCRKLTLLEGNDARMRTGKLEWIPAQKAAVDSKLSSRKKIILCYADIAAVQGEPYRKKLAWFEGICQRLSVPWDKGHIKIVIRRSQLIRDSVEAIMSLGRSDFKRRWRLEFAGEPAIDAGGVTREWFQLVTDQIFDPAFGLWTPSHNNQACCTINPNSEISVPDHLIYFRFLGRVLGRALLDRQLVRGHMTRPLYKHLLGWPITFDDLGSQDDAFYQSLKQLLKMSEEEVEAMCLDFTVTEEQLGAKTTIELHEGGASKEVTFENLPEYCEANLRYHMMDRTKSQLTELLLGFFDVIPEPALTVFDSQELEFTLCGLPTIDMDDWQANTNYQGAFEISKMDHRVVQWFWEVVRHDFNQEMKARLLQFVTGTSGVPSRGFSVLQGNDGNVKKFCILGTDESPKSFPRAHTCFNRIDLPTYKSKEDLHQKLVQAINLSAEGFGME